jgi:hypothetical protein
MFQAVQLPASVSDLNPGLADMNRDALTHFENEIRVPKRNQKLKERYYKFLSPSTSEVPKRMKMCAAD